MYLFSSFYISSASFIKNTAIAHTKTSSIMRSVIPSQTFNLKIAVIGILIFIFPRISEHFPKVSLLIPAVATSAKTSISRQDAKPLWRTVCHGIIVVLPEKNPTCSNFFGEFTTIISLNPWKTYFFFPASSSLTLRSCYLSAAQQITEICACSVLIWHLNYSLDSDLLTVWQ